MAVQILYIVVAVLMWPVIVGMFFHDLESHGSSVTWRSNLGNCLAVGLLFAAIWPVGLLLAYCLTGFAEHGIWRQR